VVLRNLQRNSKMALPVLLILSEADHYAPEKQLPLFEVR
jgi:hypothetical protein